VIGMFLSSTVARNACKRLSLAGVPPGGLSETGYVETGPTTQTQTVANDSKNTGGRRGRYDRLARHWARILVFKRRLDLIVARDGVPLPCGCSSGRRKRKRKKKTRILDDPDFFTGPSAKTPAGFGASSGQGASPGRAVGSLTRL